MKTLTDIVTFAFLLGTLPVHALSVSGFAPGVYFLQLMDEAGRLLKAQSLILQR